MQTANSAGVHRLISRFLLVAFSALYASAVLAAEPRAGVPAALAGTVVAVTPTGANPAGVAVNAKTNRVYVANYTAGTVSVLDGSTNMVITTVPVGTNPSRIAVNPVTNRVYVTNYGDTKLVVLDGETSTVVATVPVDMQAQGVAVNADTNMVYVASETDTANLRVLDGSTNAIVATKSIGSGPLDIAVNPTTTRVYVAVGYQLSVIDGKTNAALPPVRLGSMAMSVGVDHLANRIYATTGNALSVLDGATGATLATANIGKGLSGIAVNPMTAQVYLCDAAEKTVSVFDGLTHAVRTTVSLTTQGTPAGIAVNPVTNRVYVAMRGTNTACVLDGNAFLTDAQREYARRQNATSQARPVISSVPFEEQFQGEQLDRTRWMVTQSEPYPGATVGIVTRDDAARWLRLHLDTSASPNRIVKNHGVRTREALVDLEHRTEVAFTIDWNDPVNADGMAAGIYLCPDAQTMTPGRNSGRYIKVLYYGGHGNGAQGRLEIAIRGEGGEHIIYDEGYHAYIDDETGTQQFSYRPIGVRKLRLVVDRNGIAVWEDETQRCQCSFASFGELVTPLAWENCYLFLQQESAVDYPAREVFFSNVSIRQLPEQAIGQ